MNYRLLFLYALTGLLALGLTADQLPSTTLKIPNISPENSDLRFIKNEGQWENFIKYKVRINSGNLFLENQKLTWAFEEQIGKHAHENGKKHVENPPEKIKMHAYQVHFEGSNPQSQIVPKFPFQEYHNYFLGSDPSKWKGGVPLYGLLTYEELYPGINLQMYGFGDAIKYDFILQPHASTDMIQLKYEGAEVDLVDGELLIKTSLNEIRELPPIAYQVVEGQKLEIPCHYVLKDNLLSFEFPDGYDETKELIIDPTLIFSSYTGSFQDNWGFTATYDSDGNAFAGGIIFQGGFTGSTGYPTTTGAIQTSYRGGMADATISKFSTDGRTLLYSTYLGGNNHDQPHSLVCNEAGELFVLGRTNSFNFPTSFSSFSPNNNGNYDLFVTRFSADGRSLLASTYVGGFGDDGVNGSTDFLLFPDLKYNYGDDARGEIILDDAGNVYVASPTNSTNFPVTTGAFQPTPGGMQDGCVFKMPPDLSAMAWSSYIGGNRADAAYAVQVDNQGNVYVTGGTMSSNFPTTAGTYQTNYQSTPFGIDFDGFVSKISSDGSTLVASTFLGTNELDQGYLIQLDGENDVYVYGQTKGNWPVVSPAIGPVYFNPGGKQFITKLSNDLSAIVYSTVFGGSNTLSPNISPTAFLVDNCENIYVSGWGGITNSNITNSPGEGLTTGLPTTFDAIKRTSITGSDLYLMVLSRDAQVLLYGTFFGANIVTNSGEHLDGGTCRFDKNGVVYHAVCASCGGAGSTFPTTPGAWSRTNNYATNCNVALFKIAFDFAGVSADFVPRDTLNAPISNFQGCAPLRVNFENTSQAIPGSNSTEYFWDFDDGGNTSDQFEPTYTFVDSGIYNVMLVISDPISCNVSDTSFHIIEVFPPSSADAGPGFIICDTDSVTLMGTGTGDSLTYAWSPALGLSDPSIPNPKASPSTTTIYTLTVTNSNGCVDTDTLTVAVAPPLSVDLGEDVILCVSETLQLDATNPQAQAYSWTPGTFLDDPSISTPTISGLDTSTTYVVSITNVIGCNTSDTITITPFEILANTNNDTVICLGESVQLQAMSNDSNATFSWTPIAGLDNPTFPNPVARPLTTTTYTLTATRPSGCSVSSDITITVNPLPIPDAGANDTICVGETLQLAGSGNGTYEWSPIVSISDPTISNPTVNPDVSTTYILTLTDENGCSATDSIDIEVGQPPVVVANEDQSICEGEAVQLFATGALTYEWTGPNLTDPNIADPFAQPSSDAQYTVIGTNSFGCSSEDDVLVNVVQGPITSVQGPREVCFGQSVTLTASGGTSYLWSTGETTDSITISPDPNQLYFVTATDQGCQGSTDSIRINVSTEFPSILFIPNSNGGFAPLEVRFLNLTLFANRYEWDFGTGAPTSTEVEPTYTFGSPGEYRVKLVAWSEAGCTDTAYWDIFVENIALHIPSAFTPNNDGHNDEFFIGQIGMNIIQMRIFTRWGELIYESNDPSFRWDGIYKGKVVPEGVYTYAFKGLGENGILYEKAGTITVVK